MSIVTDISQLTEKILDSETVFHSNYLEIIKSRVELPNHQVAYREYFNHPGATCIIALTYDNQVIMEYQYRTAIGQVILELPAGKLETKEVSLACAKRELLEETGYIANTWVELGACNPCIGYSNEKITYYLATNLQKSQPNPDEGEFLQITYIQFEKLKQMAFNGEIEDSKTLAGLMLYIGYLQKATA